MKKLSVLSLILGTISPVIWILLICLIGSGVFLLAFSILMFFKDKS